MPEAALTALIAAVAGFLGGAVSPLVNLIQSIRKERHDERERKRAVIAKWRKTLLEIPTMKDQAGERIASGEALTVLHIHPDAQDLLPHIRPEVMKEAGSLERTVRVGGSPLPATLQPILAEIARIERKWGLRD